MKNFSQIAEAKKEDLNIQPNTINYISADDLDKYLAVAGKFISDDAKAVINWLKINNDSYLHELDPSASADNALAAFYNKGVPTKDNLKELYKAVGHVVKADRLLEIPVFQTDEQFNAIIDKKVSPDEILLDLKSEKGRAAVFKKYQPLIYKIVNQAMGKSNLPWEELYSIACLGFVNAMNSFGHAKKRDAETGKWVDIEKNDQHTNYTFGQYVGNQIRNQILGGMEDSHLVRVPKSQQKKQRTEKGFNVKSHTVSGDKTVGHDNEGNGKTLFDYIEDAEAAGKTIDNEDLQKLWKKAYDKLEDKFGKDEMTFFYRCFHINGYEDEKKKQKELAAEYGLKPTTANVRLHKIIDYIKKDAKMLAIFTDILELAHECKQEQYKEEDQLNEAKHIPNGINLDND